MPSYGVEGKRGGIGVGVAYLAVRQKSEFYQRLESVADTAHKSVALVEKAHYAVLNLRSAEERRNELAASVRLVASGKPAGNEYDL